MKPPQGGTSLAQTYSMALVMPQRGRGTCLQRRHAAIRMDRMRRLTSGRTRACAAAAVVALAAWAAPAGAGTVGHFKTPSHNVVCEYAAGNQAFLVCSIKSGLKPAPPRTDCHGEGDYTDHIVELHPTGRALEPSCAGDPGPLVFEHSARVLSYGSTWRNNDFRCDSAVKGLTCRNRSGHGFFLSRAHSHRF
jgi:hypothetical protein